MEDHYEIPELTENEREATSLLLDEWIANREEYEIAELKRRSKSDNFMIGFLEGIDFSMSCINPYATGVVLGERGSFFKKKPKRHEKQSLEHDAE